MVSGRKRRKIKEREAKKGIPTSGADAPTGVSRSGVLDARSMRKHSYGVPKEYGVLLLRKGRGVLCRGSSVGATEVCFFARKQSDGHGYEFDEIWNGKLI